MGALMVIFSLQPKQKAKSKGRLSLSLPPTPEDAPPSPRSNLLHHQRVNTLGISLREPESQNPGRERRQRPPAIDPRGHACAPLACFTGREQQ